MTECTVISEFLQMRIVRKRNTPYGYCLDRDILEVFCIQQNGQAHQKECMQPEAFHSNLLELEPFM